MARKIDLKDVKARIKTNKSAMKLSKQTITSELIAANKGEAMDAKAARVALSDFIKAANAVQKDTAKLNAT
jgi:hypothetical protein